MLEFLLKSRYVLYQVSSDLGEVNSFYSSFSDASQKALLSLSKILKSMPGIESQPVITTRIYVLHKITIALKFMSYINSDLQIPAKKLQTPG